jgi:hypothetical protein
MGCDFARGGPDDGCVGLDIVLNIMQRSGALLGAGVTDFDCPATSCPGTCYSTSKNSTAEDYREESQ